MKNLTKTEAGKRVWDYFRKDLGNQSEFISWFTVSLLLRSVKAWLTTSLIHVLEELRREMYETDWGAGQFLVQVHPDLDGFIHCHSSMQKPKYNIPQNRRRITYLYHILFGSPLGK